ncbi:MAG: hypothetical protein ABIK92_08350 [Pseudomonadota bacterium]
MRIKFIQILLIIFILQFVFGCSNALRLNYQTPNAASSKIGKIVLVLDDQRNPEKGGNDPLVIGNVRNAFGMPFKAKASPQREPSKVMRELLSSCLAAAGYEVVDESSNAPVLHATLKSFWSDGYQHQRMYIKMQTELVKEIGSSPVWISFVDVNEGFTVKTAGFKQMNAGYEKMLETTKNKLLTDFNLKEFYTAYKSIK